MLIASYPAGDCGVSQCFAHQVAQQCVGAQKPQADVGSFGEFPQHRWVGKIHGSWSPINQRNHNLCVNGRECTQYVKTNGLDLRFVHKLQFIKTFYYNFSLKFFIIFFYI